MEPRFARAGSGLRHTSLRDDALRRSLKISAGVLRWALRERSEVAGRRTRAGTKDAPLYKVSLRLDLFSLLSLDSI